eukprot:352918-Ditylum_brightwellii.AAC.1
MMQLQGPSLQKSLAYIPNRITSEYKTNVFQDSSGRIELLISHPDEAMVMQKCPFCKLQFRSGSYTNVSKCIRHPKLFEGPDNKTPRIKPIKKQSTHKKHKKCT